MKITGLSTRVLRIDASPRYNGDPVPTGRPSHYSYPLISLHTDAGIDGHSMGYGPHGEGDALAALAHDVFWPDLRDRDPRLVEQIWQTLNRKNRHLYALSDGPIGMLDVAVWDLAGKARRLPIADLLGRYRDTVPSYRTSWLHDATEEAIAAEVTQTRAAGMHGYKLQLRDGPRRDIPRLAAAREAAGEEFALMHDAVAGYDLPQARQVGRELSRLDYTWFEEPIHDRDVSLLRELTRAIDVPVLAGETVSLRELGELLRRNAALIMRGDVYLKAGITGLHKAMIASELLGYNLEIHAANTPLLDVANLHVAAAAPNCRFLETHHPVFRFGLRDDPLTPDATGRLHVPDAPGLGVELDWDWIDNHTAAVRESHC